MSVRVGEYTTYYWYCDQCNEDADCESESAANYEREDHECDD